MVLGYRKGRHKYRISNRIPAEENNLSTPSKAWQPVCAFNFTQQKQACEDLGFSDALEFKLTTTSAINGDNWEVRDGWREGTGRHRIFHYEDKTQFGALLNTSRPNSFFFKIFVLVIKLRYVQAENVLKRNLGNFPENVTAKYKNLLKKIKYFKL